MYRLSDDLAKLILQKMKTPKIHTEGERKDLYTPVDYNGIGVADVTCAVGTEFRYLLESPIQLIYPDIPFVPPTIKSFFLYRKEELLAPCPPWEITRALVDPTTSNYNEKLDVADCSIILANDIEKLTALTITTLEQLITKEPLIIDCLNL